MKKVIISFFIVATILFSGCGKENKELIAFNVSLHNLILNDMKDVSTLVGRSYIHNYYIEVSYNNKNCEYEIDGDVYDSLKKFKKLYAVTNPDKQLILDGIYNSEDQKIITLALENEKK